MSELVGKTLAGRYRVDKYIGKGGMAEVYKVYDTHRNADLAMKVLHADLALDRVFLRRFKREAQTLARLQHPNIVRFYGLEQDERTVFMLMDYIDGDSLKYTIYDADGPMPFERVIQIMEPLCKALQFAHNEGYVHADVKPGNILLDRSGRVMLSDFGISRLTEASTATMLGAGTPSYMSPEQARGESPTFQTDIYALAIVLYEMMTGDRPFNGENAGTAGSISEKILWEHINLEAPTPSKLNPLISPQVESIILTNLSKEPGLRFASAVEIYTQLTKGIPQKKKTEKRAEGFQEITKENVPVYATGRGIIRRAINYIGLHRKTFLLGAFILFTFAVVLLTGDGLPGVISAPTDTRTPTPTTTFILFQTETFTPTATPINSFTPSPTNTIATLELPTQTTASPTNSQSECDKPLPDDASGPTAPMQIINQNKAPITLSLFLQKTPFGECGYRGYQVPKNGSINIEFPQGVIYGYAWILEPVNTTVQGGPWEPNNSDKWVIKVDESKMIMVGP